MFIDKCCLLCIVGSHVSTNPNINFVVYVPTRSQSPLSIYDESGRFTIVLWFCVKYY